MNFNRIHSSIHSSFNELNAKTYVELLYCPETESAKMTNAYLKLLKKRGN